VGRQENDAGNAPAVTRNLALIRNEITEAAAGIDEQQLAVLASQILHADRVFVAGAGRSGLVLKMAAMRLMHLGLTVHVAGETTAPAVRSGDLLLVASGSGTTPGAVRSAETAAAAGARVAAITTDAQSPLAEAAGAVVVIPAARKTDHGSAVSRQYSGSLFEQVLLLALEAIFQTLWDSADRPAEELWLRHANLE
jgi:6-phospho-3-hexuloisomerase